MKIGVFTEYYYPLLGGITEHVHHFCIEAKGQGHEPIIITSNAGVDPYINSSDIEIIRIGKSMPIYSNGSIARITITLKPGKRIKEILRSEKFDIVHVHAPFVPTLPVLANYYSNTITVGTFHTQFDSSVFLRTLKGFVQPLFDKLSGRIAVSQLCIDSMKRYFDGEFRIIPNGVDTVKFHAGCEKIPEFNDGKLNIFFLSRLEPRNGLEYLIKAFSIIRRGRSDCRLIVGGDGPLKTYFKSLVPSNIKSDVHFIGQINGVRPNYYATADVFCFPTTKASFGITILEAMAAAKPVVAFSMPAYKVMIETDKEGILCGPPDAENLAAALNKLLDSRTTREEIGAQARKKAEEFSWTKITRQITNYYEEIRHRS